MSQKPKKDDKEKENRPPIDAGEMGFDEILKRMAQTDPEEVKEMEKQQSKQNKEK